MKKALLLLALLTGVIFAFPAKAAAESVRDFKAEYNLLESGLIEVRETIIYDFGSERRHGIYRFIPYRYYLDNGKKAYLNISKVSVRDQENYNYQFEKYQENGNVVLKIGDPDRTISGVRTYHISYVVKGGLKYLETGDEFYWNVNGTGWDVPVEKISATINLPESVRPEDISLACYRGEYLSSSKCAQSDLSGNKVTFNDAGLLSYEGLTVVVGVPKGTFAVMSAGYNGSGLSDGLVGVMIIVAIAIPFLVFVFMLRHWWKHGRDPKGRGTIIAEYSAPDGLTPIEVGTLLDGRVDNKDLSAEIIYLATRGYLKIRREKKKNILKKDDYTLIKLTGGKGADSSFDSTLLTGIFYGSSDEVLMSSLKDDFYNHVPSIKSQVHNALVKNDYFKSKVATTVGKYLGIAGGVGGVGFGLAMALGSITNDVGAMIFAPSFVVSALIIGAFGLLMPARTAKGVEAKERILGLKEYMKVAESDRIKFHNAPKKDPKVFEQLLPYAMVLGVEKEWAKQFENIYKGNPGWYDDPTGRIFVPLVFVNHLNSFATVATQNMMTAPSSSGSGFGGGGFSGGGFGGGGGGSW